MYTHVYGQITPDPTTHVHLDSFMVAILFKILQFRVVLLVVANIDTPSTSTRALKPLQNKEDRLRIRRE